MHRSTILFISTFSACWFISAALKPGEWTFHVHCYHTESAPNSDNCLNDQQYLDLVSKSNDERAPAEMLFHQHCYHIGCAPGDEYCLNDQEYWEHRHKIKIADAAAANRTEKSKPNDEIAEA